MKRWQWRLILVAVAASAGAIGFASMEPARVESPKPSEPEPVAPVVMPPAPQPVVRAPAVVPDEPVAPKMVPGPGVAKVVVAGNSPAPPAPADAPAVKHDPTEPVVQQYPLDPDGISAAVRDATPELRQCYELWMMVDPSFAGTLKVRMVLKANPDGGPNSTMDEVSVMADAGMGHMAFEGCVRSVLSTMRFDAPEGGKTTTIEYPFSFNSAPARK
jgi:hypothetical protein